MNEVAPKRVGWSDLSSGDVFLVLGGLLLIGASFLPWARSDNQGVLSGLSGTDFPAWRLLLVAYAFLVVLSLIGRRLTWLLLSVTAFTVGVGLLALLLIGKQNRERDMFDHTDVRVDVGLGLWVLFPAVALVLLGLWLRRRARKGGS